MTVSRKDLEDVQESVKECVEHDGLLEARVSQGDASTRLLAMSEISIWLDTYDDIFSDFDPRPYSQRSLSDDFLAEAKKASREKTSGKVELRFLIPNEVRDPELEAIIRKRLHEHFRKHAGVVEEEIEKAKRRGYKFIGTGFFLLLATAYIIWVDHESLSTSLMRVITEPSGWFLSWTGMDQILNTYKQKKPDLDFYNKMAKADIEFISITCPLNPKGD